MPRFYIFYDPAREAVRSSTWRPRSYPYIYLPSERKAVLFLAEKVRVIADFEEAKYILLAHELNASGERQKAFKALREKLEDLEEAWQG